jgi:hypothetical protein
MSLEATVGEEMPSLPKIIIKPVVLSASIGPGDPTTVVVTLPNGLAQLIRAVAIVDRISLDIFGDLTMERPATTESVNVPTNRAVSLSSILALGFTSKTAYNQCVEATSPPRIVRDFVPEGTG